MSGEKKIKIIRIFLKISYMIWDLEMRLRVFCIERKSSCYWERIIVDDYSFCVNNKKSYFIILEG